jgi:hypothetical protein
VNPFVGTGANKAMEPGSRLLRKASLPGQEGRSEDGHGFNEQNSLGLVGLPCHRSGHDQSQSVNDATERSTKQEGAEPRCPQPDRLKRRRLSLEG